MNFQAFSTPRQLERNSFLWSEVRLVIAAVALFIGGVPPVFYVVPVSLFGITGSLLKIAWLVSGVASVYLLWRWNEGGKTVFGGKNQKDTVAFLVSVVSGINLGLAGLLGTNVGMSILAGPLIFWLVGALYLWAAVHLWRRWKAHGQKVF